MRIQVKCAPEFYNNFWQKKLFLFFKNNFTRIKCCKFIHPKSHLKPFLSYFPCIVRREYFSIILNVKKCALHSIKYGTNCANDKLQEPFSLNVMKLVYRNVYTLSVVTSIGNKNPKMCCSIEGVKNLISQMVRVGAKKKGGGGKG
jgi:hypothetical protein